MNYVHENIMVPDGFLAWIYLHSENKITSVEAHWHRSLELTLMLQGESIYHIDGNKTIFTEDEMILINSGVLHSCQVNEEMPYDALTIIFPFELLKAANPDIEKYAYSINTSSPEYAKLVALFKEIHPLFKKRSSQPYYQLKLNSVFYEILYILMFSFMIEKKPSLTVKSQKYWDRCQTIIQYIDDHYNEQLTLDSVSREYGISKEHLSRTFKEYMGTTFKKHLTRVRLFYVYQLLVYTDFSLLEIAMQAGFTDSRSLINCFKELYGITPQKYRKTLADHHLLRHKKYLL
ncbi:AraC family transcriptional regulator [Paenibacillus sp. HW567]|uniref:AraC family transcriptional regulator n=1 Tax=Paenibacillus sp. HW567 TaxID=1034769 RepID=UPI00038278F5|nr:AraC family transcriptional regulator [Paenibacillus sp. HW567]